MKRQKTRKIIVLVSFMLFPLFKPFLSPVTVVMGVTQGVVVGGLAIYATLFLSGIFLGRAYCGWLCPAGGLQEYCAYIVPKAPKTGRRNLIKYFLWFPFVAAILVASIFAGGLKNVDFFYQQRLNIPEAAEYVIYYAGIVLILALALKAGKRAECHYVCWLAPFMVAGDKLGRLLRLPVLHMRADAQACTGCGQCGKKCAMSLDVQKMVMSGSIRDTECILCGECADACPKKAIHYQFGCEAGRAPEKENPLPL